MYNVSIYTETGNTCKLICVNIQRYNKTITIKARYISYPDICKPLRIKYIGLYRRYKESVVTSIHGITNYIDL